MRRPIIIFLVFSLAFSTVFSACGTKQGVENNTVQKGQSTGTQKEPVVLTLWVGGMPDKGAAGYQKVGDSLQTKTGYIKVETENIPWTEYFTKLNVGFAGGTAPDIFHLGYGQMGPTQAAGNLLALDDYLKDWDGWKDIPENLFSPSQKDGKLYGMFLGDVFLLFYRPDFFKEAGLDPEKPPRTLNDLKDYAKRLAVKKDNNVVRSGFEIFIAPSPEQTIASYLLMSKATDVMWDKDYKPTYDKAESIAAIDELSSYFKEGLSMYTPSGTTGYQFENGTAAMGLYPGTAYYSVFADKLGKDKVKVALPPNNSTVQIGIFLALNAKTKNPQETVAFFKELMSSEGQMTLYNEAGVVPARKSIQDKYISANPELNSLVSKALPDSQTYGVMNPYFFDYVNFLRTSAQEIYYGKKSAKDSLTEAAKSYRDAIVK